MVTSFRLETERKRWKIKRRKAWKDERSFSAFNPFTIHREKFSFYKDFSPHSRLKILLLLLLPSVLCECDSHVKIHLIPFSFCETFRFSFFFLARKNLDVKISQKSIFPKISLAFAWNKFVWAGIPLNEFSNRLDSAVSNRIAGKEFPLSAEWQQSSMFERRWNEGFKWKGCRKILWIILW